MVRVLLTQFCFPFLATPQTPIHEKTMRKFQSSGSGRPPWSGASQTFQDPGLTRNISHVLFWPSWWGENTWSGQMLEPSRPFIPCLSAYASGIQNVPVFVFHWKVFAAFAIWLLRTSSFNFKMPWAKARMGTFWKLIFATSWKTFWSTLYA